MTLAAAITALHQLSITGLKTSYSYDSAPAMIPSNALPAAYISLGDVFNKAFSSANIAGVGGIAVLPVEHTILYAAMGIGRTSERDKLSITLIDNYLSALAPDLTLGGALLEPLEIAWMQTLVVEYGNSLYRSLKFTHVWKFEIAGA